MKQLLRRDEFQPWNERYSIITKYQCESSNVNSKLQALFSTMIPLFVLLITITLVILPAEAQPFFNGEKRLLDSTILFFLDEFEYIFEIDGTQIFPNDTLKDSVLTEYKQSVYNISRLQYKILEHTINASDVQIHVDPTRIDDMKTRFDIEIYANNAEVTGQWLNRSYENLDLKSIYGIYDRVSDKMIIHVPYSVALSILLQ
jgi:hypothetical protein